MTKTRNCYYCAKTTSNESIEIERVGGITECKINCLFVIIDVLLDIINIDIGTELIASPKCHFIGINKAFFETSKIYFLSCSYQKNPNPIESVQWTTDLILCGRKKKCQEDTRTLSFTRRIEKGEKEIGGTQSIKMSYEDVCVLLVRISIHSDDCHTHSMSLGIRRPCWPS